MYGIRPDGRGDVCASARLAMRLPDDAFKSVRTDLAPLLASKTPAVQLAAMTCFARRKDPAAGPVILAKLRAHG